jgi:tRNA A58 N-methylase Trm61
MRPRTNRLGLLIVQSPMTLPPRRALVTALVLATLAVVLGIAQSASDNAEDAERLVKALEIRPGSTVAEIGAGTGALTIALAKVVGETGRVFSSELGTDRIAALEKSIKGAGLTNVSVVEARAAESNLPDQCCGAIFMRNVYHHFGDPPTMNASLMKSLKPGGRLAVIDFMPPGRNSAEPGRRSEDGHHGVTAETVEQELKSAGFEIVSSTSTDKRGFMVVARRAMPASHARGMAGREGGSSPARTRLPHPQQE